MVELDFNLGYLVLEIGFLIFILDVSIEGILEIILFGGFYIVFFRVLVDFYGFKRWDVGGCWGGI